MYFFFFFFSSSGLQLAAVALIFHSSFKSWFRRCEKGAERKILKLDMASWHAR